MTNADGGSSADRDGGIAAFRYSGGSQTVIK